MAVPPPPHPYNRIDLWRCCPFYGLRMETHGRGRGKIWRRAVVPSLVLASRDHLSPSLLASVGGYGVCTTGSEALPLGDAQSGANFHRLGDRHH